MGRPTKYTKETVAKARAYLDDYQSQGHVIPSAAGLACYLGVGKRTLYDWAKDEEKEEFSHMLDSLNSLQERLLLSGGLSGEYNATIAKLVLSKHGYTEKTEQTLQGPDGGSVQIAFNPVSNGSRSKD